jgi:hypothetical protein
MFLGAVGGAGAAFFLSFLFGLVRGSSEERKSESHVTELGTVDLELSYTCHPDHLFAAIERDISVLDLDDRIVFDVYVRPVRSQGWKKAFPNGSGAVTYVSLHGSVGDLPNILRALLMDDDSPLTVRSSNERQRHRNEIRSWAKRSGMGTQLSWLDSDSPLTITIRGHIRNLDGDDPTLEVDKDTAARHAAEAEVDALTHKARLVASHKLKSEG